MQTNLRQSTARHAQTDEQTHTQLERSTERCTAFLQHVVYCLQHAHRIYVQTRELDATPKTKHEKFVAAAQLLGCSQKQVVAAFDNPRKRSGQHAGRTGGRGNGAGRGSKRPGAQPGSSGVSKRHRSDHGQRAAVANPQPLQGCLKSRFLEFWDAHPGLRAPAFQALLR